MKYYDDVLQSLQKQLSRKKHLKALLNELYSQKTELEAKVNLLKEILDKEKFEVARLEKRGLIALFYEIAGRKQEKLDEQRRDIVTAKAKYDVAMQEFDLVHRRIERYEIELAELNDVDMKYAYALKKKVEFLKESATPVSERILQFEEQISRCENQKKEIREAILAGTKAKNIAEQVLAELDSAEGWGTWDLFGGGLISDLAKHSHLDDAQDEIEHLQVQLRRFKIELSDVTVRADMQVNIDGFLRFADYFFDGLFADWAVLDKIEESKSEVKSIINQIQAVLEKLASMLENAEADQENTSSLLNDLIINS